MLTEKDIIRCEAVFNDDHTHRLYWKRVWNKDKPLAAVVMLNPCLSDNITTDTTTTLVVNNVARLGEYGGVIIINLFSVMTSKLELRWSSDEELNIPENDQYIAKAVGESNAVILAWGKGSANNQRISERAAQVLQLLGNNAEKLWIITDGEREGLHPLTPSVRSVWQLKRFEMPEQGNQKKGRVK